MVENLAHDRCGDLRRYGKADADIAAGAADDGRVDADEFAAQVDERAARVTRVDRRVGLDEILQAVADTLAAKRADDARCDRVAEAERIADCYDEVADANSLGVADRHLGKTISVHLEYRNIGFGIGADDFCVQRLAGQCRPIWISSALATTW